MRFSERIGKRQVKIDFQMDSMDMDLRNGLWNIVTLFITYPMKENTQGLYNSKFKELIEKIWILFFKEPIDQIPYYTDGIADELKKRFYSWDYLEVYDFIDFINSMDGVPYDSIEFTESCNIILKRELSGYRFVQNYLAPITNELEINEVERAIEDSANQNYKGSSIHLKEALNKLSDKYHPDYRNSIKESISAVESICLQITNDPKADLSIAFKKLSSMMPIHGALKQGFLSLYGYTSNGDGIRHAMMDESNLDQEDALYMLITCSSFVNYLISKANKLGIKIRTKRN